MTDPAPLSAVPEVAPLPARVTDEEAAMIRDSEAALAAQQVATAQAQVAAAHAQAFLTQRMEAAYRARLDSLYAKYGVTAGAILADGTIAR